MKAFHSDHFVLPLPENHRFPMEKYARLRRRVATYPGIDLRVPAAATEVDLLRVHDPRYVARVVQGRLDSSEVRQIGFPWSLQLVERSRRSVGATVAAARSALEDGVATNLAGGTHHAFADHGEGFCVFNDVAVAVRTLQAEGRIRRAAVLDLDVHQGNGTAAIFRHDDDVLTASVHGAGNYPFRKEHSDLDLALPDRAGDAEYLEAVRTALAGVLDFDPDVTFFVAGADPFEEDRLGRLSVSREGLAHRDRIVLDLHAEARVPVAIVMAGGYATDIEDTVAIHAHTVREAARRQHGLPRFATG